jgi:hypothetical protein
MSSIVPTAKATKAELIAYINHLEVEAIAAARCAAEMRERISILEGTRALGLKPQPQNNIVVLRGVSHHVFTERHGARTTKRFVPIERDLAHEKDLRDLQRAQNFADCEE